MAILTPTLLTDAAGHENGSGVLGSANIVEVVPGNEILLPSGASLTDSNYLQQGDDLVLIGPDGTTFVVRDYFVLENPPDLVSPEGARMTAALVESFTPPESAGQYAQAGQIAQAAQPIGQVQDLTGQVFAVRADGTRVALTAGDPVFQGDVIETADDGAISLLFVDETTFALGDSARLALDEMVYDPSTEQGQSSFSILKGVFVFVSGQIAHTDNTKMTVTTPVATIGIRGTKVAGDVRPAGEESKFTVIDGEIAIITQGGTVLMSELNATTIVISFQAPPTQPIIFTPEQMEVNYGSVGGGSGDLSDLAPASGGGGGEGESTFEGESPLRLDRSPFREDESLLRDADNSIKEEEERVEEEDEEDDLDDDVADELGGEEAGLVDDDDDDDEIGGEGEGEGELPTTFNATGSDQPENFTGSDISERIIGGNAADTLSGLGGDDIIEGGPGADNINGGDGNDFLFGGDGDDSIFGGLGDDTFVAASGAGDDTYNGGEGSDIAFYSSATSAVNIDLADGDASGDPILVGTDQLISIENIVGGSGDDVISGDNVSNILNGGAGNDGISGRGGNDLLFGDAGNDIIDGGAGDDLLDGSDGNDTLTGGAGVDLIGAGAGDDLLIASGDAANDIYDGGVGFDTLDYSSVGSALTVNLGEQSVFFSDGEGSANDTFVSIESFIAGSNDDTITTSAGDDTVDAGADNDVLFGSFGNDFIDGGAGFDTLTYDIAGLVVDFDAGTVSGAGFVDTFVNIEDVILTNGPQNLIGGAGADNFIGGGDNDTIDGAGGDDTIAGAGGNDFILGGEGNDLLTGGDGGDTLTGGAGDDIVEGGGGDDILIAATGAGDDTYDGGDGIDSIVFSSAIDATTIDLEAGTATGVDIDDDIISNIENVTGGAGDDTITGSSIGNTISGAGGNDTIDGREGDDSLSGDIGNDTLIDGLGADIVEGGDGDDRLIAADDGAVDTFSGGVGSDTIVFAGGTIDLAAGTIIGASTDTLIGIENAVGGDNGDTIIGDANVNILDGADGDDTLTGGGGNDVILGGSGNDTFIASTDLGDDDYDGGVGDTDILDFSGTTLGVTVDLLNGTAVGAETGTDTVANIEHVIAGAGDDTLQGGAGNETLDGGIGVDLLIGGAGDDVLTGAIGGSAFGDFNSIDYSDATAGITALLSATGTVTGDASVGTDTLLNIDRIFGSAFADNITADSLQNGNFGLFNDIEGQGGDDIITGNGSTRISFRDATGAVTVDIGAGTAIGDASVGADTFTGVAQIRGSAFDDILTGSDGSEFEGFRGERGDDLIDGGDGFSDQVDYFTSETGVTVNLSLGPTITVLDGLGGIDTVFNIERIRGSEFNDVLTGDSGNNKLIGESGDDTLDGGGGQDVLVGGAGDDFLTGSLGGSAVSDFNSADYNDATAGITAVMSATGTVSGDESVGTDTLQNIDRLFGTDFADSFTVDDTHSGNFGNFIDIEGQGGDDVITGSGNTRISFARATGAVSVDLGAGTAVGDASVGSDTFTGVNQVKGSDFADTLVGGDGEEFESFRGLAGDDFIDGGGGSDDRVDYVNSLSGVTVDLSDGDTITVSDGFGSTDTITNIERLRGSDFDDTLSGDAGVNVLQGRGGADVLDGGAGADVLRGEDGDDTIIFDAADTAVNGGSGGDTLQVTGGGVEVDLIAGAPEITNIERIDLTGEGDNTVTLSEASLIAATEDSNQLFVTGDAGDEVFSLEAFVSTGTANLDGIDFQGFTSGDATLFVQTGVSLSTIPSDLDTPPSLLADLDGTNGFRVNADSAGDFVGEVVSHLGDINNDGFADFGIGQSGGEQGPLDEVYVVFGGDSGAASIDLSNVIGGSGGFNIIQEGAIYDGLSEISSAGDVNGDGIDDIVVGARSNGAEGAAYVVFGSDTPLATVDLADIALGNGGFKIVGEVSGDQAGRGVSAAGDVNGDGFDDVIVGAPGNDTNGGGAGAAYVVFGTASPAAIVNLSDVANDIGGIAVFGEATSDSLGRVVSNAGDVNGDGIDDIILGTPGEDTNGGNAGAAYVLFGASDGLTSVDLSSPLGDAGFKILGEAGGDNAGISVSTAGDVNGDGIADLVVGAFGNDAGATGAGASYVIFGSNGLNPGTIDLGSLGGAGYKITGVVVDDYAGISVSGAGDINGDGIDDLLVGASANSASAPGSVFAVFGVAGGAADIDLADIAGGIGGFQVTGEAVDDRAGRAVSVAGDLNGDGFDDLIVGAPRSDTPLSNGGAAYVVFGGDFSGAVTQRGDDLSNNFIGTAAIDVLIGGGGSDLLAGNGGADVLRGGEGADSLLIADTAFSRLDGGLGDDQLTIAATGVDLDLTVIGNEKISGIETVGLSNENTLTLEASDVAAMSDTNTLTVLGDDTNAVVTSDIWTADGAAIIDGQDFLVFTSAGKTLFVDVDVDVNGIRLESDGPPASLADLDGTNGFKLLAEGASDAVGEVVSALGDINNDGFADFGVAQGTDEGGGLGNEAYVVFGSASNGATVDLGALGAGGFTIVGEDPADAITQISSAGDVNGDGIDDFIVSAYDNGATGAAYVIFGANGLSGDIDLATLGAGGVKMEGVPVGNLAGTDLAAAGDINGDGFGDVLVGAGQTVGGETGVALVIFGDASPPQNFDLFGVALNAGGFAIASEPTDNIGARGLSTAGDFNGDGIDDLLIGSSINDQNGADSGAAYVVFGSATPTSFSLSDLGANGIKIVGEAAGDFAGSEVSAAGDVNGDGLADIVVGAFGNDQGGNNAGAAYVVFGSNVPSSVNLGLLGGQGYKIVGEAAGDDVGISVSGAGDINGDGLDDLLVGGRGDNGSASAVYVVFGVAGSGAEINLDDVAFGVGGFRVTSEANGDFVGQSVSMAGDLNGDGFDDLLVGAPGNDVPLSDGGAAYVVFGGDFSGAVTQLGAAGNDTLTGSIAIDVLVGGVGDDLLIGNGGADVLKGGAGDDTFELLFGGFQRMEGGLGNDTMAFAFNGSGGINFATTSNVEVSGIEVIDLTGTSNNSTTLSVNAVNAMSDTNTLTIAGDLGDSITTTDLWNFKGAVNIEGETFRSFEVGATTLLVDFDVDTSGIQVNNPLESGTLAEAIEDPDEGFKITGETPDDFVGSTVSGAGDVNGDGILDFIVGGNSGASGGAGAAYVVFGIDSPVADVDLASLGTGGFRIDAEGGSTYLGAVSGAGDINGDGLDDLVVGDYANGTDGAAYVVFGKAGTAAVDLSALNGSNGFKLTGPSLFGSDQTGFSVSGAGDFNGDGFEDFLIGARNAEFTKYGGGTYYNAGLAYVVFGSDTGFGASVDLAALDGITGTRLLGEVFDDRFGSSVSGIGDVNGDGLDDVAVGAASYSIGDSGAVYIVFGDETPTASLDLEQVVLGGGPEGFRITGVANNDLAGVSVSGAGDVNGDGIADLLIGASGADASTGAAYVVFGANGLNSVDLGSLNGTDGFLVTGEVAGDNAGSRVSSAGDVNGDGFDDFLVGAYGNDYEGNVAGATYLVFGRAGFSSTVSLSDIANGVGGGVRLTGNAADDHAGSAVSAAGDVDGDGFDDIIIGAQGDDQAGSDAGAAFVLFGRDITGAVTRVGTDEIDVLSGNGLNDVIIGGAGNDQLFGGGGADVIRSGSGDDIINVTSDFARVHGGLGRDEFHFSVSGGASTNLDLTALGDLEIEGIEEFLFATSLDDATEGSLTLGSSDVRAISDTDTLTVSATNNSFQDQSFHTVVLDGDWQMEDNFVDAFIDGDTRLEVGFNVNITTTGAINVSTGADLAFASAEGVWAVQGEFTIEGPNTLTVSVGTLHIQDGALFDFGAGTVDENGGVFLNEGVLSGGTSPGAAVVNGDLAFGDTGSMLFELGGLEPGVHDGFDILSVSGIFDANGTIDVVEYEDFDVSVGDSFAVVEAGALNGEFDDVTGLDVGGGVVLDAVQSANGVTLTGKAVTHQGTAAAETQTGGAGDDVFVGGGGGDFILGRGGADLMHGGDGDDVFVAPDTGFGRIDGGDGFDTIRFEDAGQSFDLGGLRGHQINAIESFDLSGGGDNTLTLDADMAFSATRGVNALTGTEHSLIIDGDAGDVVEAGEGWTDNGTVTIGGDGYSVYESDSNGAQIYVNTDVAVTVA